MKPDIRAALFASDPFNLGNRAKAEKKVNKLYFETKKNYESINLGRARIIKHFKFRSWDGR
jgi:hypothetical protein